MYWKQHIILFCTLIEFAAYSFILVLETGVIQIYWSQHYVAVLYILVKE